MNVAIVHDSLTEFGGAERVLWTCLKIFPNADVYVSCIQNPTFNMFTKSFPDVHIYPLFDFHFFVKHTSLFQLLSPVLWKRIKFTLYDFVVIISGHLSSILVDTGSTPSVCYVLSPPKNIYALETKTPLQKIFPYERLIRPSINVSFKSKSHIITLSKHMQNICWKLFDVYPEVIYPPVNIPDSIPHRNSGSFFLVISRLDRSKKLEIAIEACNRCKLPLVIVGETNEQSYLEYLKHLAGTTITFVGFRTDQEIERYFLKANALIFTSECEDFGIVPVEAMAHGVPVIAYYGGGVKETVTEGKTGKFFYEYSAESLIKVLKIFDPTAFSRKTLYSHAKKFSTERFKSKFLDYVNKVLSAKQSNINV